MVAALLESLLGAARFAEVDEALVEYIDGVVRDDAESDDDKAEAVAALLEDCVGGDAGEAERVVRALLAGLRPSEEDAAPDQPAGPRAGRRP